MHTAISTAEGAIAHYRPALPGQQVADGDIRILSGLYLDLGDHAAQRAVHPAHQAAIMARSRDIPVQRVV